MAAEPWVLDDGLSQRAGTWHVLADVMIVGFCHSLSSQDLLREWFNQQSLAWAYVDGCLRKVAFCGGVQAYCESISNTEKVFLHSKGEDALDSLSECSKGIAAFVNAHDSQQTLIWHETRHDRKQHQLLLI